MNGRPGRLPWDDYPPLRMPDQSRYGPGPEVRREDPRPSRWRVVALNPQGVEISQCIVNGDGELEEYLSSIERRDDFGAALALPLRVRRSA